MKVLYVITGLAYGGAETQIVRLATSLKARGWEVKIVSLTPPKAYMPELEAAGIQVVSLGILSKFPYPRPIMRLAQLVRTWRPQIVHSFMVQANLIIRFIRLMTPIPVLICSARNIIESRNSDGSARFRELFYRLTDPLCDLTTQVSQAGLIRYVRVRAVPPHKIRYIPNGVDMEHFYPDPDLRKRLQRDLGLQNIFVWLAIGRFDLQKDYPNMLQALAHIIQERPEILLLIVGDGPLRSEMEDLAQTLGLWENVRFLGIRRDVKELMNVANAYIMSSTFEGMANVLLEAGASGLPIVATDVGGNREVVLNGETGILVPPQDPVALAGAMVYLMDLPERERQRIGMNGHQYIKAAYSLDRVVELWEALYKELLFVKGFWRHEA